MTVVLLTSFLYRRYTTLKLCYLNKKWHVFKTRDETCDALHFTALTRQTRRNALRSRHKLNIIIMTKAVLKCKPIACSHFSQGVKCFMCFCVCRTVRICHCNCENGRTCSDKNNIPIMFSTENGLKFGFCLKCLFISLQRWFFLNNCGIFTHSQLCISYQPWDKGCWDL